MARATTISSIAWLAIAPGLVATGCGIETSGLAPGAGGDADPTALDGGALRDAPGAADAPVTRRDGGPTGPDAGGCGFSYVPAWLDPCDVPAELPPITLSVGEHEYDTEDGELTAPDDSSTTPPTAIIAGVRVLFAEAFSIDASASLRVVGPMPLAVVSRSEITITGRLDASSDAGGDRGAGSNPGACSEIAAAPGQTCLQHGGSGGGGGGLAGRGGNGGRGAEGHGCPGGGDGIDGGAGGGVVSEPPIVPRGGCDGADGAPNDEPASIAGEGGAGGGALHLLAAGRVSISGVIDVGGAGGAGAEDTRAGGGGGGSGGAVIVEAAEIDVTPSAVIAANGGGGGGGCDNDPAQEGADALASAEPAAGGLGDAEIGNGGAGGSEPRHDGTGGANANRGGGGGGGGVGFVVLLVHGTESVDARAVISPPAVRP